MSIDLDTSTVNEDEDVVKLAYELIFRRYVVNKDQVNAVLKKLTITEYIILYFISDGSMPEDDTPEEEIFKRKTYLRELEDHMQMTTRKMSKQIRKLQDRGLLFWGHDGDGSEGTYVTISKEGLDLLHQQEIGLRDYFSRVIDRFGAKNVVKLLTLMRRLEEIMDDEFHEKEDPDSYVEESE